MSTKNISKMINRKNLFIGVSVAILAVASIVIFPSISHADPDGTQDNPYLITTCIELQAIPSDVPSTVYYKLEGVDDTIDCSVTSTWNPNDASFDGFDPIDNFGGVLDGNDNTITGLHFDRPSEEGVALFRNSESGAYIHDLTIADADITGSYSVGSLIGYTDGQLTVENVTIDSNTIHGTNNYVGGLIGNIFTSGAERLISISGVTISADVTGDNYYVGGLVGTVDLEYKSGMSVSDTEINGHIIGDGSNIGGIIGDLGVYDGSEISISDSSWGNDETSTINGFNNIGGAVGYADIEENSAKLTLSNVDTNVAINEESYTPEDYIGGLIGQSYQSRGGSVEINDGSEVTINLPENSMYEVGGVVGLIDNNDYWESSGSSFVINGTTVDGSITTTNDELGGLVGYWDARDSSLSISDSSTDINLSGAIDVGGLIGGYYMYGGSFLSVSGTNAGGTDAAVSGLDDVGGFFGYTEAWHGATTTITDSHADYGTEGQITSNGVFQGDWCEGLYFCTGGAGGMFGHSEQRFGSNMTISNSYADVNISLTNIRHLGGMFGFSTIRYNSVLTINDGSYVDGSITSASDGQDIFDVGGFIGQIDSVYSTLNILDGSYNNANIAATDGENTSWNYDIGGLVGYAYSDQSPFNINFDNVSNTGNVTAGQGGELGGFIGYADSDDDNGGTIVISGNSTNSADISNDVENGWDVGGFIGESDQYAISVTDSTVTSDTISGYSSIGGFFGYAEADNGDEINITSSSWGGDTSVVHAENGYVAGLFGELDFYYGGSATITNSSAVGTITGNGQEMGGFIGELYGYGENTDEVSSIDISGSFSNVPIPVGDSFIGGLIGEIYAEGAPFNATIADSNSQGNIGNSGDLSQITGEGSDGSDVGGLVGIIDCNDTDTDIVTLNIDQSSSTGDISGLNGYMGGLVGYVYDGMIANIDNSFSTGNVTTDDSSSSVGGIVGDADGDVTVTKSYATGDMTGDTYIGGLIGDSDGALSIDNSYATGNIVGNNSLGGLIGWADSLTLDHSYASGDVTAETTSLSGEEGNGGLIGFVAGDGIGTVSNSFATGNVSVVDETTDFTAGLIGQYYDGSVTLTNNYYDSSSSGQIHCSYASGDGVAPNDTEGQCENINHPVSLGSSYFYGDVTGEHPFDNGGWHFDTVWKTNTDAYPTLQPTYHITASAGSHGSISPSGVVSVSDGGSQSFTITPTTDYARSTVLIDGVNNTLAVTTGTYLFTDVTANHTIHVTFTSTGSAQYTLTTHTSGNGTGSITLIPGAEDNIYDGGTDVTLVAAAAAKSTFKSWTGCSSSTSTHITVTMTADTSCTAIFNKAGSSGSSGGGGSVSNIISSFIPLPISGLSSPTDCKPGYLFSPSTGRSCSGTTNNAGGIPTVSSGVYHFLRDLKFGMTGEDVKVLQIFLNHHGFSIAPSGMGSLGKESTFFGKMTQNAVVDYQKARNIVPAVGYFGPKTRASVEGEMNQ